MILWSTLHRRHRWPLFCSVRKPFLRRAFTLVETAVVIFIMGITTAWAITHLRGSIEGANIASVKENIGTLEGVAHSYAMVTAGQAGGIYSGLSPVNAPTIFPQMYVSTGYLPNAFGGEGTVVPNSSNPDEFIVTETGLPPDACTQLQQAYASHGSDLCSGTTFTITEQ